MKWWLVIIILSWAGVASAQQSTSDIVVGQPFYLVSSNGQVLGSITADGALIVSLRLGGMPLTSTVPGANTAWNVTFYNSPLASTFTAGGVQYIAAPPGILLSTISGYLYSNMTGLTTTYNLKGTSGFLHTLVINTRGTGSTATVYDSTSGSGTIIAKVDTTLSTTAFIYDAIFNIGLSIVMAGAGAADVSVTWR